MVLKNYYRSKAYQMSRDGNIKVLLVDGTKWMAPENDREFYEMTAFKTSYSGVGIVLGDGTTPPTIDDYKLSGTVITGVTGLMDIAKSCDDEGATVTFNITVINNNSEEITVGEVGACSLVGGTNAYTVMYDRTVLDAPVTIPAGGVGQVTYTIRMNYPTA